MRMCCHCGYQDDGLFDLSLWTCPECGAPPCPHCGTTGGHTLGCIERIREANRRRCMDLDVGRWLAVEEPDEVTWDGRPDGPPRIRWRLRERGDDEVEATFAGVMLCLDCVYLDDVSDLLARARDVSRELAGLRTSVEQEPTP